MGFLDKLKGKAGEAGHKVAEVAGEAKEKAAELADKAGPKIGDAVDKAKDFIDEKTGKGDAAEEPDMAAPEPEGPVDSPDAGDDDIT